jgi:ABC-type lipoprotein release transport system permease subunit
MFNWWMQGLREIFSSFLWEVGLIISICAGAIIGCVFGLFLSLFDNTARDAEFFLRCLEVGAVIGMSLWTAWFVVSQRK